MLPNCISWKAEHKCLHINYVHINRNGKGQQERVWVYPVDSNKKIRYLIMNNVLLQVDKYVSSVRSMWNVNHFPIRIEVPQITYEKNNIIFFLEMVRVMITF